MKNLFFYAMGCILILCIAIFLFGSPEQKEMLNFTEISIWFLIIIAIVILMVIIIGIWFLYQIQITTVKTGTEKYIVQGETYEETINDNTVRHWFWKFFGVYYIGLKFQGYDLAKFDVNTDKENPEPVIKTIEDFILKGERKKVDYILQEIPRALVIKDAELGGPEPVQVDAGISIIFSLIDGKTFGFIYRADFAPALTIIQSKVNDVIRTFTHYSDFINSGDTILDHLLDDLKLQKDLAVFGLKLKKIKMPFRSTDKSIEEAARLETIAELEQSAAKIKAKTTKIEGKAKADVEKMSAKAPVEGLVKVLKDLPPATLEAVTEIQKSANLGGKDSKITTLVEKGNSTTTAITPKN